MSQLLSVGIFPVVLTLAAFLLGQTLQKKLKSPLLNPILISVVLVLLFLYHLLLLTLISLSSLTKNLLMN